MDTRYCLVFCVHESIGRCFRDARASHTWRSKSVDFERRRDTSCVISVARLERGPGYVVKSSRDVRSDLKRTRKRSLYRPTDRFRYVRGTPAFSWRAKITRASMTHNRRSFTVSRHPRIRQFFPDVLLLIGEPRVGRSGVE